MTSKKPFVEPILQEEAALATVTLLSGGDLVVSSQALPRRR